MGFVIIAQFLDASLVVGFVYDQVVFIYCMYIDWLVCGNCKKICMPIE